MTRSACSGADPVVAFASLSWPADEIELTVLGNTEHAARLVLHAVLRLMGAPTPP